MLPLVSKKKKKKKNALSAFFVVAELDKLCGCCPQGPLFRASDDPSKPASSIVAPFSSISDEMPIEKRSRAWSI